MESRRAGLGERGPIQEAGALSGGSSCPSVSQEEKSRAFSDVIQNLGLPFKITLSPLALCEAHGIGNISKGNLQKP